jgi:hypothetical protein
MLVRGKGVCEVSVKARVRVMARARVRMSHGWMDEG